MDIVGSLGKISQTFDLSPGNILMMGVGSLFIYLAIKKEYEPLVLLPLGITTILVNLPAPFLVEPPHGLLYLIRTYLIDTEVIPLLIFFCLGAMIDFGPLIANPISLLVGAATQMGIFIAFVAATFIGFNLREAASIGIIGGATGPVTIYLSVKFAPNLLAAIAVAAYSYMALVPLIQPPIIKALTSKEERRIRMKQLRCIGRLEKILFAIITLILVGILVPHATPLVGLLMVGNIFRESKVVERLVRTMTEELMNICIILLGLGIGSMLRAETFLQPATLIVAGLGALAFATSTASGILFVKLLNLFLKEKINPLVGAAGVSAVPMSARIAQRLASEEDPENFLLMHSMGPNVAGGIGAAVVAGIFLFLIW
ncbi:MAG: sodium ion-translocating decarboxylase subunit beta [Desulfurococcaceae archaeon]